MTIEIKGINVSFRPWKIQDFTTKDGRFLCPGCGSKNKKPTLERKPCTNCGLQMERVADIDNEEYFRYWRYTKEEDDSSKKT